MIKEVLRIVSCPKAVLSNLPAAYISDYMIEHLNIKENTTCTLVCGINKLSVQLKRALMKNPDKYMLWLEPVIFRELLIPEGTIMEVAFTDEIIKIGPVIGILTEKKLLRDYMNGNERVEEYSFYADMAKELGALIYIFSLSNLKPGEGHINGYLPVWDGSKWTWRRCPLPMPDVVCNRMAAAVTSPAYKKIKLLSKIVPGIKIVNRVTKISKWKIADILQRDPEAKGYIPETHPFEGPEDIIQMLERYKSVYLKPVRRSLGLGIVKLVKNPEGNYTAYYSINGENHNIKGDINWILEGLGGIMGKRGYIVQQGINVALYKEKLFDLRVTVQKDGSGEWSFVRWGSRVAAPGSIVSNVAAGGIGLPARKVLMENFSDRLEEIKDEVENAGFVIARALDKRIDGLGDLGLDIGIDTEGRVYLFEVNFRAIRPSNLSSRDIGAWHRMYHTPLYYLKHLYDIEMDKKNNPQS